MIPKNAFAAVGEHRTVLLNDNSIFELVLKDELILGVVGILECELLFYGPPLLSFFRFFRA